MRFKQETRWRWVGKMLTSSICRANRPGTAGRTASGTLPPAAACTRQARHDRRQGGEQDKAELESNTQRHDETQHPTACTTSKRAAHGVEVRTWQTECSNCVSSAQQRSVRTRHKPIRKQSAPAVGEEQLGHADREADGHKEDDEDHQHQQPAVLAAAHANGSDSEHAQLSQRAGKQGCCVKASETGNNQPCATKTINHCSKRLRTAMQQSSNRAERRVSASIKRATEKRKEAYSSQWMAGADHTTDSPLPRDMHC